MPPLARSGVKRFKGAAAAYGVNARAQVAHRPDLAMAALVVVNSVSREIADRVFAVSLFTEPLPEGR